MTHTRGKPYNTGDEAKRFGSLPFADQFARSLVTVNELHPGHGADLPHPVAVAWQNVPFNKGPWFISQMVQARNINC
jgi:monoamine oxidase